MTRPSRPQLLPYEPAHVLAGKAKAKPKPTPPPFDQLLISGFAGGTSSGAKVPGWINLFPNTCSRSQGQPSERWNFKHEV